MRRAAIVPILAVSLGMGFPYALDGHWWVVLACGLAGGWWLFQSLAGSGRGSTVSFVILAAVGSVGVFLGHDLVWLLTNFVMLLVAWDLDHFGGVLAQFSGGQDGDKEEAALVRAHLIRLVSVAGAGWVLGLAALNVRIPTNLGGAMVLGLLVLVSLRRVVRELR